SEPRPRLSTSCRAVGAQNRNDPGGGFLPPGSPYRPQSSGTLPIRGAHRPYAASRSPNEMLTESAPSDLSHRYFAWSFSSSGRAGTRGADDIARTMATDAASVSDVVALSVPLRLTKRHRPSLRDPGFAARVAVLCHQMILGFGHRAT